MKLNSALFFGLVLFIGCTNHDKGPDVSNIKVDVLVERFDKDFFSMDTVGIEKNLNNLQIKYPSLYPIFLNNILGLTDTTKDQGATSFIRQNKSIADAVNKEFNNTDQLKKDFEQSFRYVKYYFPDYKIPKVITIVGPPDALAQTATGEPTPNFIGPDFLGVSLQFYLGKDFPIYHDGFFVANVAPEFRSRRFDKKYLVADAMKLIADDIYPDNSQSKGLIEQMIEKGKQWWLLDKFLPGEPDTIKTGYTKDQLKWSKENEGLIWNDIITTQKDLYTKDPLAIQSYIGEAPYTQALSEESPGNIGPWIGWQIIKKFADKNSSMSVDEILKTDVRKILELAKYKPK
jgi:hypothetical protein